MHKPFAFAAFGFANFNGVIFDSETSEAFKWFRFCGVLSGPFDAFNSSAINLLINRFVDRFRSETVFLLRTCSIESVISGRKFVWHISWNLANRCFPYANVKLCAIVADEIHREEWKIKRIFNSQSVNIYCGFAAEFLNI